jgi:hypothetical protein
MRSVSAGVTTAFASGEVALATLVKIEFPGGTIALNASLYDLTHNGTTYLAASGLGRVSAIQDSPSEMPGLKLELLRVDSLYIGLALDDADEVQGSAVTLSTAVLDSTTHQILDVFPDWTGYADTMSISEDGKTASISVTAESKAVDLLRGTPMVYNDADQQSLVPGDLYFQYVASQSDKPVVWPSRGWFYK